MRIAELILIGTLISTCIYLPIKKNTAIRSKIARLTSNRFWRIFREAAPVVLVIGTALLIAFAPELHLGPVGNVIFVCAVTLIEVFLFFWTSGQSSDR